jgi:FlaA1/EpsC-like NDP-sugar epimerase
MISTDKAVNPAGIMGSTKRVCELMVTAAALRTGFNYCSTRFGNVLGSSGSLIPLLKQQIESGGPVTITHPEMTRFFMLIPEAVSLVLKAATISQPGDINILRMGEPIRIVDVAKSLIALMGRSEDEVPIVFTGLRPGEKMFEELYIRGDEIETEHPDVLTLRNGDSTLQTKSPELSALPQKINKLIEAARAGSPETTVILNELVKSNYVPKEDLSKDLGTLVYLQRSH